RGGYQPTAALVQGPDGTLFGTTQFGGTAGGGTLFKLSTNGTDFALLYNFGTLPEDPLSPQAPLCLGSDGALYGTTSAGGASAAGGASGYGAVFRINADGSEPTVLHSFMPSQGDGQRPYGGLVQGSDGNLYGTTQEGGITADGGSIGFGTVFKIQPDGTDFSILHHFNPADGDGKYPNSALVIGNDGALYGTTEFGGKHNLGSVFRLKANGSDYQVLYSFGSRPGDGSYPKAPLVRASDGGLFGTAQFGGDNDLGTIFRLGPAPAVISAIQPLPDNTVLISLTSAPHFQYRIEGSSDQVHWVALTNLYNTHGTMQFIDTEAPKLPQRFYRAAWVP
ncbi:MAG TPA: choice-of-anchor tandem repeat GloVer-containing protein, partial [Clostridia bacterium]|nr:choice-of-anchor tandem repeat GloVer-containing protein [Clostridia bacterium]